MFLPRHRKDRTTQGTEASKDWRDEEGTAGVGEDEKDPFIYK